MNHSCHCNVKHHVFPSLGNQTDSKSESPLTEGGEGKRKEEDRGGGDGGANTTGSSQDKDNR